MPLQRQRRAIKGKNAPRAVNLKRALACAGISLAEYAESLGVHPDYIRHLVTGRKESVRTLAKIDDFIAKHIPNASEAA
jgi:hypothetical protein